MILVDKNYDGTWTGSKQNMALKVGLHVDNSNPENAASIIINENGTTKSFDSFPLKDGQFITVAVNWVKRTFEIFDQDNQPLSQIPIPSMMDLSGTYWLIGDPWVDVLDQTDLKVGQICFQGKP
jgi:hypothetical protein